MFLMNKMNELSKSYYYDIVNSENSNPIIHIKFDTSKFVYYLEVFFLTIIVVMSIYTIIYLCNFGAKNLVTKIISSVDTVNLFFSLCLSTLLESVLNFKIDQPKLLKFRIRGIIFVVIMVIIGAILYCVYSTHNDGDLIFQYSLCINILYCAFTIISILVNVIIQSLYIKKE